MNQRGSIIPVIALFFGAAVVVLIFGYMLYPKDSDSPSNQPVPVRANSNSTANANSNVNTNMNASINENTNIAIAVTVTWDWKTYENSTLGYHFKYPATHTVATNGDVVLVYGSDTSTLAKVTHRLDAVDGSLTTWYDTTPVADAKLGDVNGKRFEYRYCDGPSCGPETVAFVVQRNGKLLGLEFPGDKQLSATEQAIYDSFAFQE